MPEVAGEGALFVDPYSEADIARSLLILIEENDVYSRLASAAQRNAARFDWGKAASDMKELIESALRGRA
jgi:glycosyltransferase involved in cell wall biosynthesis